MDGVFRYTIDLLLQQVQKAAGLGIKAIALFPVIEDDKKSDNAEEAYNPENLICRAVRAIRAAEIEIGIICDVALDPYTSHGQDGIVVNHYVTNDKTVEILCKQAVEQARAGCDIIAPSDMMDGRIGEIRKALDKSGFIDICILSYAAKYASSFYGPFRDAVGSSNNLGTGDKKTYQMNPANSNEALQEVAIDIKEGADMVMVKPGMPYLDIVKDVSDNFAIPVFAYQVSGEYAMMVNAAKSGLCDRTAVLLESLISFKRAGATAILTYAAIEIAETLKNI
jgi:porphobilinogen synthase